MTSERKSQTFSSKAHLNWGLLSKLTYIQELAREHFHLEVWGKDQNRNKHK